MKKIKITYWSSSLLISLFMTFSAYAYLTQPAVAQAFVHLGFPAYFRVELAIAKLIGAILLLTPVANRIKEWTYAGFALVFISAFIAHSSSGDPLSASLTPLFFLGLLITSYITYHKMTQQDQHQATKKVVFSPQHESIIS